MVQRDLPLIEGNYSSLVDCLKVSIFSNIAIL